jgi:death-on-curing family protein
MQDEVLIYQTLDDVKSIEVILKTDTIWLTQEQISYLYGTKRPAITKHLKNIFNSGELNESVVCSILEQTTKHGAIKNKTQISKVKVYNLDAIISVGYRVNSKEATRFRQWATQRLKDYLVKGYAINQKRLEENKAQFLQTLEDLKQLAQNNTHVETKEILTLIQNFSATFFALDSYDKNEFPHQGNQKEIVATAQELKSDLQQLKEELIKKGEATELFAQEKQAGNLEGIFGNVFQTVFGQDAYPTVEEKAAHLLYFIVKNHPFNDGNKRCGAFSFVWLLQKAGYSFQDKISPETLTTLTLLIAESNPLDKEKMIGIVKLLLNFKQK